MKQWKLLRVGADYEKLGEQLHIDPMIVRIMCNRGLRTFDEMYSFLYEEWKEERSICAFTGAEEAVKLLLEAHDKRQNVRVIGDYDIDGICATAILVKGLRCAGLHTDYAIPHRIKDGYGLNISLIQEALDAGIHLLITCDNGISAKEAIAFAKENGMRVIVTDHHEVPLDVNGNEDLPPADVIIDPKMQGFVQMEKDICGAFVAYLLMEYFHDRNVDLFSQKWNVRAYLEMAAFATIGDVMSLTGDNRALVKFGLKSLQNAENLGFRALIATAGKPERNMTAYQIGFVYGPCINATGRLDTAERALQLLLTDAYSEALVIADELKLLNEERKEMTKRNAEEAFQAAAEQIARGNKVLVLYLPNCHESIAGIIAGRVKELYYRPTLVITDAQDGLKGSGRSIEGYSMFERLSECKGLFTKYGGHPMAAGFSLKRENLSLLEQKLNEHCALCKEDLTATVKIDVDLPFSYITEDFIHQMEQLEPYGNGNPRPVFAQQSVRFLGGRIFGKNRNCAAYRVEDRFHTVSELKFFGDLEQFHTYLDTKYESGTAQALYQGQSTVLSVIYYPEINSYRGKNEIQLIMQDYT